MSSVQIEVVISPKGETSLKTVGFNGSECRAATRALEAELGQKLSETLTAEFHQTTIQENNIAEHHGTHP